MDREARARVETETLTLVFEDTDEGWVAVHVAEVPGAISQGRSRGEARVNAISALHDLLSGSAFQRRAGELRS